MKKFYTLQDSKVVYLPQKGLHGEKWSYDKYENLGNEFDQHLLLRSYIGETQYGELTEATRTEVVGIVNNAWVRKHYFYRPFYYGCPVVWKGEEVDAIDYLQQQEDKKLKEEAARFNAKLATN